jgi:predicted nucleic acid-binding protein
VKDLVVDANVLFSAAIKDSATARMILRDDLRLHAPAYLFDEFETYEETILERTQREAHDFDRFVSILRRRISSVQVERYEHLEAEAESVCPDPGDIPYFAVALAMDACLWTDDRELQDQSAVPVVTTRTLLEKLET